MNPTKGSVSANVIVTVALLALFGGGAYFFLSGDSSELSDAKTKVETETAKLDELNTRYEAERKVIVQIQEQYSLLRDNIVNKMDYFFVNPNSSNPKISLKISDKAVEKDINNRRLEITRLLESWDKKFESLNSGEVSGEALPTLRSMISEAKSSIEYVEKYITDLGNIVNNLTPTSSQLQQTQIYTYQSIVESSINQVTQLVSNINSIEDTAEEIYHVATISNPNSTQTSSPDETTVNTPPSETGNGGSVLTPTPTPTSPEPLAPVPPIVTPSQIQAQAEALAQAQAQQAAIEQQTNTNQTPTPTPANTSTQAPTTVQIQNIYSVPQQTSGSQTVIEYLQSLPFSNVDRSGWPDRSTEANSGPALIDG